MREEIETQEILSVLEAAHRYRELGLSVIPLWAGEKKPMYRWEQWARQIMSEHEVARQFSQPCNIGIVTGCVSGIVVVDGDSPEACEWIAKHVGDTPVKVKTPRGIHFYYACPGSPIGNRVHVGGRAVDVRGNKAFVVAPPSVVGGKQYERIGEFRRDLLLPLRVDALAPHASRPLRHVAGDVFDLTERARRYISKIVSVAGEGGHNAAFRAACKLREFGLPMEAAWPLLLAWNDMNATPPWTPKELRHKLEDAYERR